MTNINVTPEFILAGEATFTVSNNKGKYFTYHIYRSEPSTTYPTPAYFAKLMIGSENTSYSDPKQYSYMGMVRVPVDSAESDPKFVLTKRSQHRGEPAKVLRWALRVIWQVARGTYRLPEPWTIQNIGHCGRCGRPLTTPASLDTGLGPECAALLGIPHGERRASMPQLFNADDYNELAMEQSR